MDGPGASHQGRGAGSRPGQGEREDDPQGKTWRGVVGGVSVALRSAVDARVRLFRVESRRALQVAAGALALAAAALLMLATAWLSLVGAVIGWAVLAGFQWPWVLLAVGAACLLLGWLGMRSARALLATINFDATARALHPSPARPADPSAGTPG